MGDSYLLPLTSASLSKAELSDSVMNFVPAVVIALSGKVQPGL